MRWLLRHKKLIAVVIGILAIVAMAMWPEAIEVDLAQVTRGPMQVTLDEDGETRVRDRFVVSAPVAGRLLRVELEPGDAVVKSKTIVARLAPAAAPLLDPRTRSELDAGVAAAKAAVGQAQAERDRAATALTRARTMLGRQRELNKAGAISADDLEAADTAVRVAEEASRAAEFTLTRSQHELELARARLTGPVLGGRATVDVVAPVSGVILKRLRESETVVPTSDPILEIGDPSKLEIVADFLSTDAVQIRPGTPVLIEQWGGGEALNGRVRRVEPSGFMKVSALGVEEQRVNVLIDFVDPPSAIKALGDAYRVEVRVVTWQRDSVVKVPVGALFRRGEGWALFLVDQNAVKLQPVKLGQRNDTEGEILDGLSEGQTVVLHPPDTLQDAMRIKARGQ